MTELTSRGVQRREELLDAAQRVMTADTSMRAIAAEAGVRLGHLQHYFPSRADLVQAVLERTLQRALQRLEEGTGDSAPDQLVTMLLAEHDDSALVRLYVEIWALAARDESISAVVRGFYERYVDHVSAFIGWTRADLPPGQCRARAATFVSLLEGAALMRSGIAGNRSPAADAVLVSTALALLDAPG